MSQFFIGLYKKIQDFLIACYKEKNWGRLSLCTMGLLAVTGSIIYVVYAVISILWNHIEDITVTVGAFFIFLLILQGFWQNTFSRPKEPDGMEDAFQAMEAILEDNYETVSKLMAIAINDVADVLKLKRIESSGDMTAGVPWVRRNTFVLYLFAVLKTSQDTVIDTSKFKDLLNRKIQQKLDSGTFPGLVQTRYVSSGGISLPLLIVDEVTDTMDGYLNLYVAWVGEDYAQYYMAKRMRRPVLIDGARNRKDVDF